MHRHKNFAHASSFLLLALLRGKQPLQGNPAFIDEAHRRGCKRVQTHAGRDVTRFAGWAAQTQSEDDPGSPPRRKGKGGRQRAPAPDASVDPKRAKRIMANRASAAKSKEKQKQKVQVSSIL